jgi:nucleoside-triphosphatase
MVPGRNILLTGPPGVGKTTVIQKVVRELDRPVRGFYTQEIRERNVRVGFSLNLLGGPTLTLAHVKFKGRRRVGKYGVDVETFEEAACREIEAGLAEGATIVIDEIGKMELFSERFRVAVLEALDSDSPVLATILFRGHPFTDMIRSRPDVDLIEVRMANRDDLPGVALAKLGDG